MPEESGYIPDFAPESLRSEFYFVGRIDVLDAVIEERTNREGETFTSRQVILTMRRLDREADEAGTDEFTSYYGMPRQGWIAPDSPLGQLITALKGAGTAPKTGKTFAERKANLRALQGGIYVTLARRITPFGSERSRLYLFPQLLVGKGAEWSQGKVDEFFSTLDTGGEVTADKAEASDGATPKTEAPPSWWVHLPAILEVLKTVPTRNAASVELAGHTEWGPELQTDVARGSLFRMLEEQGYIRVSGDAVEVV